MFHPTKGMHTFAHNEKRGCPFSVSATFDQVAEPPSHASLWGIRRTPKSSPMVREIQTQTISAQSHDMVPMVPPALFQCPTFARDGLPGGGGGVTK